MIANFGGSSPEVGISGASDDPDGDGFSNLEEYLLGSDPNNASSNLKVTDFQFSDNADEQLLRWTSTAYEFYHLERSIDRTNWSSIRYIPGNGATTDASSFIEGGSEKAFFRINRLQ